MDPGSKKTGVFTGTEKGLYGMAGVSPGYVVNGVYAAAISRRRYSVVIVILIALAGSSYALLRHTPWMISRRAGNQADASRQPSFYAARLGQEVDSIVVIKHLREMNVYRGAQLQKIYRMSLGDAPEGHKHFQGDEKTPEGLYHIDGKNPYSSCHKNLGISYPNAADRAYAAKYGKPAGGDIKIHGLPNGQGYIGKAHLLKDWTNGCVGVTDDEIDELYNYTKVGAPVLILPDFITSIT